MKHEAAAADEGDDDFHSTAHSFTHLVFSAYEGLVHMSEDDF